VSELAFSFGRIAAEYDDVRPEYASEALDRAEEALELGPGSRIVDLAAGSGKLTRALARRFDEVVAVEPNEEMRAARPRARQTSTRWRAPPSGFRSRTIPRTPCSWATPSTGSTARLPSPSWREC
jgi:hypothetical protein